MYIHVHWISFHCAFYHQLKIAASSLANHHELDACAHAAHCGIQVLRHRFECQVKLIDEFANVSE